MSLAYEIKLIVGKPNLSDQFKKITKRFKKVGLKIDIVRKSACPLANPIKVYSKGFLFNCTMMGPASNSMAALTLSLNQSVGVWCLPLAGPSMAQLEIFFSSDYLLVVSLFLCFIIVF